MIRTQISLDEQEMERLRDLAQRRGVSIASLVRSAVDRLLAESEDDPRARARNASGRFRSGRSSDTSVEHDRALDRAFSA